MPTLKDLGYPFVFDSPWGIAGPKGMDQAVVKKLHDAFKLALEDPGVVATMDKYEMLPNYLSSEEYTQHVPKLIAQERAFVDKIGLLLKQ